MTEKNISHQRHSLAHLLAAAVLELYPDTKPTIGPAIDNGFYYDFEFSEAISDKDLPAIQSKMESLLKSWQQFSKIDSDPNSARERYQDNPYKLELIDDIEAKGETLTLYQAGDFIDLCRGGHIEDMTSIQTKSFCLDRVAGAYWRGDANNKMLTRIYGLAFTTAAELDAHLKQREEAAKYDHRKLGKELDLFTFSDLVGPGFPLFTAKGTVLRNQIIKKIHQIQKKYGYEEVWIPHLTKKELYQTSGHWDKFGDELFYINDSEGNAEFVVKPMNCPHHTQIYASKPRSYRDLPVRLTEATTVYRNEKPGELLGLSRVRSLTQDDGHVFCTIDQVEQEIKNIVAIIKEFYSFLGMFDPGQYWVSLSVRDPKTPDKYIGQEANWTLTEKILEDIAQKENFDYRRIEGEAAFYGAKLDFIFKDALGREWQLATIQLDFIQPERFGLEYIAPDGSKQTPVMIHRAIAGSLERFLSIMIEHFAGAFPVWLAPVQVTILPVSAKHRDYAETVFQQLKEQDIRVGLDADDTTLGKKIRTAKQQKIPYLIIIGDKEVDSGRLTIEQRDSAETLDLSVKELVGLIKESH